MSQRLKSRARAELTKKLAELGSVPPQAANSVVLLRSFLVLIKNASTEAPTEHYDESVHDFGPSSTTTIPVFAMGYKLPKEAAKFDTQA